MTSITDVDTGERATAGIYERSRLLDVQRHCVDEVDRMPLIGEPAGVYTLGPPPTSRMTAGGGKR
jgi:hypothetical protein